MQTSLVSLGDCGCGGGCGCHGKPRRAVRLVIDTPYVRGSNSELGITKALGYVLGLKGLEQRKLEDSAGPVMTRASNVASLTALFLLKYKPEAREDVMVHFGGLNWTQDVLKVAKNYPGGAGVADAVRFSLGLHFLIGIMDAEGKRDTPYARAYLAFARIFKDAQDRRAGREPASTPKGLGGLGDLGALGDMVSDQKWCEDNAGKTYPANQLDACKRCPQPGTGGRNNWNYWKGISGKWECLEDAPSTVNGRKKRGLPASWSPPQPAGGYPAPPNVGSVDRAKFQVASCGTLGADQNRGEKEQGIRRVFKEVFGRDPNNAEVQYYGYVKWCIGPDGKGGVDGDKFRNKMVDVRSAIQAGRVNITTPAVSPDGPIKPDDTAKRDLGSDITKTAQQAADAAFDVLNQGVNVFKDVMCKGFKQFLGPVVGGVLCDIITFLLNSVAATAAAAVNAAVEMLKAIIEGVQLLVQGKAPEALQAILSGISVALFSAVAPIAVPLFMGNKKTLKEGFDILNEKAKRVAKKNPLFPVVLVMAVVNLLTSPTLNTITGVTIALAPLLAVFLGDAFSKLLKITLDAAEDGIERFIKLAVTIVQGVMALQDIIPKLRGQLEAFYRKKFANGPNLKNVADTVDSVLKAFQTGFSKVEQAIKQFQFNKVMEAATTFLNLVPDVITALVGEEGAASMPSLTDWRAAVTKSVQNSADQQRALQEGALQLLKDLPVAGQLVVFAEQSKGLPIEDRAKVAAQLIGPEIKKDATFPQFVAAFRTELLKVN